MDKFLSTARGHGQIVTVPHGERWSINRRLKELHISCACPNDGTLRVDVHHPVELILVHSVIRRFTIPRQDGIAWLERCWKTQTTCTTDH